MATFITTLFGIPTAFAAPSAAATFVGKVNRYITNPLIILMFAVALVYFLYGVLQFILNSDKADEREIGKNHMIWGIIGMFIMFAVGAILHLIINTIGGGIIANPNLPS